MPRFKLQGGYTLIEVMLVLAITTGLLAVIWSGQSTVRARVQFGASIESLKNTLKRVQNEATTTVNAASAGSSGEFVFGKMVIFNPTTNIATVYTLTANDASPGLITQRDSYTFGFGQFVNFVDPAAGGNCYAIVFSRAPDYIYTAPPDPNCYTTNATGTFTYSNYFRGNTALNPTTPASFNFIDHDFNFSADIVVDTQNSTITRVIH